MRRHFSPQLSTGREQGMQKAYIAKSSLEMSKGDNRKKGRNFQRAESRAWEKNG